MMFVLVHLAKNVSGDSKTNFILCFDELRSHIEFVHIFEMSIALLRPQNTLRMQSFDRNRGCIGLYLAFMPLVGFVAWRGKTKNFHDKMRKSFDASSCEKRCVEKTAPFRDHESWQSGECRPLATHLGRLRANPRRGKLANMIRFQDQDLYGPASTSTVSSISTWIKFLSFFLSFFLFALCCTARKKVLHCIHDMFATQFLRQAWPSACASFLPSSWLFSTPSSFWRLQLCIRVHFNILHLCDSVEFRVSFIFWYWVQETCTDVHLFLSSCCNLLRGSSQKFVCQLGETWTCVTCASFSWKDLAQYALRQAEVSSVHLTISQSFVESKSKFHATVLLPVRLATWTQSLSLGPLEALTCWNVMHFYTRSAFRNTNTDVISKDAPFPLLSH